MSTIDCSNIYSSNLFNCGACVNTHLEELCKTNRMSDLINRCKECTSSMLQSEFDIHCDRQPSWFSGIFTYSKDYKPNSILSKCIGVGHSGGTDALSTDWVAVGLAITFVSGLALLAYGCCTERKKQS